MYLHWKMICDMEFEIIIGQLSDLFRKINSRRVNL
jgi:hypothetical protein